MKFRSSGAEIVSNVALGRRQNEPNQRVSFRDFNFEDPQNAALESTAKDLQPAPSPRVILVNITLRKRVIQDLQILVFRLDRLCVAALTEGFAGMVPIKHP